MDGVKYGWFGRTQGGLAGCCATWGTGTVTCCTTATACATGWTAAGGCITTSYVSVSYNGGASTLCNAVLKCFCEVKGRRCWEQRTKSNSGRTITSIQTHLRASWRFLKTRFWPWIDECSRRFMDSVATNTKTHHQYSNLREFTCAKYAKKYYSVFEHNPGVFVK